MRILNHDYAGHAFTVQLSRELARRGHEVLHVFSANLSTTPQGVNTRLPGDPAGFSVEGVDLGRLIDKQNYKKLFFEDDPEHAAGVVVRMDAFRPDVVISGNASPGINNRLIEACWVAGTPFVCWVQDLFGPSAGRILPEKFGRLAGGAAARLVDWQEQRMLSQSDGVVVISEAFRPFIRRPRGAVTVIENWAPMEEMPLQAKANFWSEGKGLAGTRNFVYSGTIGMKHNPELLVRLADRFRGESDVRVVVVSAGKGMEYLEGRKAELGLDNLVLMGFQAFEDLPKVLGSGDVLVAVLEPDAGVFSVPSKVLSYLCAGRAVLLAVPPENLASQIVTGAGAGKVVSPEDVEGFVSAGLEMMGDGEALAAMGAAARGYAERTFEISGIAARFEEVFRRAGVRG